MLSFLLLCLFGFVVNSTVISLPRHPPNGTEFFNFPDTNATVVGNSQDPASNASSSFNSVIDRRFRVVIDTFPDLRISGKSTYMSILKAMIQLSYSEGTHQYTGETFSFRSYANVKIRITAITSSGSTLLYQYALWGLYRAAQHLTTSKVITTVTMTLFWEVNGEPLIVGKIEILPDSLPDTVGSTEVRHVMEIGQQTEKLSNFSDVANFTSIKEKETDLLNIANAGKLSVLAEFQGQTLTVGEVFMTLFAALLRIASFGTGEVVRDFEIVYWTTQTELAYEHYDASRASPPFFTYHAAARALKFIPTYMFAQGRFESVTFVLEINNIPVGTGYLRKWAGTPSTASDPSNLASRGPR